MKLTQTVRSPPSNNEASRQDILNPEQKCLGRNASLDFVQSKDNKENQDLDLDLDLDTYIAGANQWL